MNYTGNGQYNLARASLFFHPSDDFDEESEIDLSAAFVQIDLYESIWNQTMSGSIAIMDTFNLHDFLPLYGNERIELEFHTMGNEDNPIIYEGLVYKVTEKHRLSEHASGYSLYFVSKEAVSSQRMVVQRAFSDTADKVVDKIFKRFANNKPLVASATTSIQDYVFGSTNPLEAISIVSTEAYSTTGDNGYLFYENNKEFNFKPLQELYQKEPIVDYHYKLAGSFDDVDNKTVESFDSIQDIQILEENSFLDRIMEGQHGLTNYRFDLFSKSLETSNYDKESFYNQNKSLGTKPYKKRVDHSNEDVISIRYGHDPATQLKSLVASRMSKVEIGTVRVMITVFGDSILKAGDTCNATLPNWNSDQDQVKNSIDGKFLVSEIHHTITNIEYMQSIMLQKESYES